MAEEMKREMSALKSDMTELKGMVRRIVVSVAKLTGKVADMEANMATKKDIGELNARMDGFSGLLLDMRHRWAIHADTLVDHDKRLKKLEPREAQ